MKERLTFGFRNTELVFGIFVFFAILTLMLWMIFQTTKIFLLILFWQFLWGFMFGFILKTENIIEEKGYYGAFLWAIGLLVPLSFLVGFFSFGKIGNFINKL